MWRKNFLLRKLITVKYITIYLEKKDFFKNRKLSLSLREKVTQQKHLMRTLISLGQ
jgi:hypothetical protein